MSNVLLLGLGTQGLSMTRCLTRLGHKVFCVSSEKHNYADDSRYVSKAVNYCGEDLLEFLDHFIAEHKVDVLIPMGDKTAEFVSRERDSLERLVKFVMPCYDTFVAGYDKNRLMSLCAKKGYPHPQTLDLSADVHEEDLRDFPYPAMLKPNQTTGGRGMVEVFNYLEFQEKYPSLRQQYGDYHLQKFIKPGGRQVKVQLYIDQEQRLVAHSVIEKLRWYPNKAGSSCCAVSIQDDDIVAVCYNILKDIGWVGFADFDTIEDVETGELLVMEINPRVPACIEAAVSAGVNWGEVIVNGSLGIPQKNYLYETGVCLRHLGLDSLWFKNAENRWRVKPSWFKLAGRRVHYQDMSDWTDPKPFICGTLHNLKKLFDPSFKKAKQGV